MLLSTFPRALLLLAVTFSTAQAAKSPERATVAKVFQLANKGTWFENLAVRRNGKILATRADVPELWTIDPVAKSGSSVHSFPPATALTGITEIGKDVFAVAGLNRTAGLAGQTNTGYIFLADFSKKTPTFRTAATLPDNKFVNGLAAFDGSNILATDSGNGQLLKINIKTGQHSVVSDDTVLSQLNVGGFGINGVKYQHGYAYFTSSQRGVFGRIPLKKDATAAGKPEVIARVDTFLDDFALSRKGVAYATTNPNNTVIRITPGGQVATVAGAEDSLEVGGATAAAFARGGKQRELYVTTSGAQVAPINGTVIEPAKVVKLMLDESCYE